MIIVEKERLALTVFVTLCEWEVCYFTSFVKLGGLLTLPLSFQTIRFSHSKV